MTGKDYGPRGLSVRSAENILMEIRDYAQRAEAIRDLGSSATPAQRRERERLIHCLMEDCEWLQFRDLEQSDPTFVILM